MWEHYHSIASKVNKEDGEVQVAALLTLIVPEDTNVFKTWNGRTGVIERFEDYCKPRKNGNVPSTSQSRDKEIHK